MITIKEALTKKDMKDYVMFSFELYKNNPYWIPPIIAEELETFDKTKNPALQTAEAHFYLAYKDDKIVGKIAAIINWEEVTILEKRKVRFGWFDAIDDVEVTKALLNKVEELGKKHQMDHHSSPNWLCDTDGGWIHYTSNLDLFGCRRCEQYFPRYACHSDCYWNHCHALCHSTIWSSWCQMLCHCAPPVSLRRSPAWKPSPECFRWQARLPLRLPLGFPWHPRLPSARLGRW